MREIPKAYEPQSVEDKWYDFWLKQGCFTANPARVSDKRPAYSIVIPPPNVTGMLHMGHVLNNTIQDILARKARMDGKEVLWLPGTDHAGIATEGMVSKQIWKEEKKPKREIGRDEFIKRVWLWKEKHGGIIISQLKKLGCSCDWTRERFTMDPEYVRNVQRVFVDLYKKGLIYRGKRMVNWCPATLTALSDEEVEMESQKGFLYYFKVEVVEKDGSPGKCEARPLTPALSPSAGERENRRSPVGETAAADGSSVAGTAGDARLLSPLPPGGGEGQGERAARKGGPFTDSEGRVWLIIATTRPETIPGDTAIAVNPKDPRYAQFIGKHVIRPLPCEFPTEKKLIPILGDEYVDFEFGTGVLKVTPAHDKNDFDIGQRHKLAAVDIMNPNGSMNDLAGQDLAGLDRFAARKVAVEKLKELGALEKEEPYENKIGFSQRARVPIEPRLSEQWFLKYPTVRESRACVEQRSLLEKPVRVVTATGRELRGSSIKELRRAATAFAKTRGIIGRTFKNVDSGIEIRVGRQSLTHAFSNLGVANIKAVAVLPQLIQQAVWLSSAPHVPPNPMFKQVHRFIAALSLGGELHQVLITAKEFWDGTILYDHKAKKITLGGKSLEAHPREGKLDTQPAPSAELTVGELLEGVNAGKMRFHPDRWAKVYDHWLTNIQDWCISRQLWWGHRIPVWRNGPEWVGEKRNKTFALLKQLKASNREGISWRMPESGETRIIPAGTPMKQPDGITKVLEADMPIELIGVEIAITPDNESLVAEVESLGLVQDPDVLDTWCSSWLWPFATMGWTGDKSQDSKNPTLQAFYPTTDLVTGPDIIFFWVARMIMAGYEYMGELPFKNVYFTGIIRDKQGRKMSKTLGNSPDPLVLITQYGADALRFGTMRSAPLGQDVLFDEKDVELGRNFCNKLWNACRFRQMQSQSAAGVAPVDQTSMDSQNFRQDAGSTFEVQGEIDPRLLTSDDKWILLKLDQAIREVSTALNEYKFSEATAALYRFFWSEYCDWYVEATKAVLTRPASEASPSPLKGERAGVRGEGQNDAPQKEDAPPHPDPLPPAHRGGEGTAVGHATSSSGPNDARRANTLAVIDFVLSHTLRLFHPFLPFITEELWHGMGYASDMPADQGGQTIMNAPWPKSFDQDFRDHYALDDCYLEFANDKYEVVTQGRNLRRIGNIQAGKKVKFVLKPSREILPHDAEVIKILLNAEALEITPDFAAKKGTPTAHTPMGELFLPLEGLVDVEAEKARLTKEKEKITAEIVKVEQKLANPAFTSKVPAAVLLEHQQRLTDWQAKLAHVVDGLKSFEG